MSVTLVAAPEPVPAVPPPVVAPAVEPKIAPPAEQPVVEERVEPDVEPEPPAPVQQPKPKPKPVHKPVVKKAPREPTSASTPVASEPQDVPIRPAAPAKAAPAAANATSGPKAVSRPDPSYPERARALGIEGTVKIQFDVNNEGLLENVQVISATPRNVFEREIRQVTRRWRYESGKPAKNIVVIIQFKLTGVSSAGD